MEKKGIKWVLLGVEKERETVSEFLFYLVDKASGYVGVTVAYRRRGSRSGIDACRPQ